MQGNNHCWGKYISCPTVKDKPKVFLCRQTDAGVNRVWPVCSCLWHRNGGDPKSALSRVLPKTLVYRWLQKKNEFYDKLHLANAVYCLIFLDSHKGHELIKGPEKLSSHETYCMNQCFPNSQSYGTWRLFSCFNLPFTSHWDHVLWCELWESLPTSSNNMIIYAYKLYYIQILRGRSLDMFFRKTISIKCFIFWKVLVLQMWRNPVG